MVERQLTPQEVRMMFAAQDKARLEAESRGQAHILADEQVGMDPKNPTILGHRGIYKRRDGTMYYQTGYIRREEESDQLYGFRYEVAEMWVTADIGHLGSLSPHMFWIVMADCSGNNIVFVCNKYHKSVYT